EGEAVKGVGLVARERGSGGLVIFGFFGSGAPSADQPSYLCSDSAFPGRAKNALTASEIGHEMQKLKSQRFCAFLDVNFRGYDPGKTPPTDVDPEKAFQEFFGSEKDEDELPQKAGRVVFAANDGMSQSIDLDKHGIFAKVLL